MSARRCPSCGSAVTPFAAGCAVCGADLEAHRARQEARRAKLPSVDLPRPRIDPDHKAVAITALVAVFMPILALVLAFVWARDPMRARVRTALYACGVVAVVMLAIPELRFGILSAVY